MSYEQLILQNNSLNKIVVVLWFFLFCQIICIQFSNLQAVKRDWQSFNEQIYGGGGWGGFDAILQNQVFPDFTISEVGINIFGVHVML